MTATADTEVTLGELRGSFSGELVRPGDATSETALGGVARMLWGGSSAATNGITSASQTVDVSLLARASTSLGSVKTAAPSAEQHFGDRSRVLLGRDAAA